LLLLLLRVTLLLLRVSQAQPAEVLPAHLLLF
jgi:hypothetical protein